MLQVQPVQSQCRASLAPVGTSAMHSGGKLGPGGVGCLRSPPQRHCCPDAQVTDVAAHQLIAAQQHLHPTPGLSLPVGMDPRSTAAAVAGCG